MQAMALTDLPLVRWNEVFHVGFLEGPPARKAHGSQEGALLPVSRYPDAWRRIARLGDAPTWTLRRRDGHPGAFVDYLALGAEQREALTRAAIREGLVVATRAWRVARYFEEYDGEPTYFVFASREEAEAEAVDDDAAVEEIASFVGTPALARRVGFVPDVGHAEEHAHVEVLRTLPLDVDGVWWNERFAPDILSAPRGGVAPEQLVAWEAREPAWNAKGARVHSWS